MVSVSPLKSAKSYVLEVSIPNKVTKPQASAYLFLHGFPATKGTKNQDIAEALTRATGIKCYVLHFRGLGASEGHFSFVDTLEEARTVAAHLINQYGIKTLNIVGHSWGGLVGIDLFQTLPQKNRGQLILMAPFSEFPQDASIRNWLNTIEQNKQVKFSNETLGFATQNFYAVETLRSPLSNLQNIQLSQHQIVIIEAKDDPEVPNAATKNLAAYFNSFPTFITLDLDHSFLNDRNLIIETVVTNAKLWLK